MRIAVFAVLGLVVGSFLTVLIHRVPRRESIVRPGSRCPACGFQLQPIDNIPVLSYLLLRGRCRACGEPISITYPLVEIGSAALFVAAVFAYGELFRAALIAPFLSLMLAVAVIDARYRIVPNRIVYPALVLFALAIVVGDLVAEGIDALRAAVGMLAYALPLFLMALALPHGVGMGDVKLVALIGLVLGSLGLAYVAAAAGIGIMAGGVGALIALAVFRYGRKQQIPFGPFLALGGVVAALAGSQIASAYLSLLR
ncbi:MAG TPA: prepilin peptidase [Actinomycetota bacterium]|nr:prepilin peptidase [Actinomycetota bacterium]